jgi:hydroxyacylglutathione hydrolase
MMRVEHLREDEKLSLTNDGELELFFLGVGSAFATTLYQLNFLLIKGDTHILVDFGMTGPIALRETAKLQPTEIEVVLPSHSHSDHVGGFECLALMNRYIGQRFMGKGRLKMIIDEHYQNILWTHTLQGGLEWNETGEQTAVRLGFDDFFEVIRPNLMTLAPREIFELDFGGIHLEIFRTNHVPKQAPSCEDSFISYGVFVDDRLFISIDTKYDRELIDLYADRSEVMFHDVQFFPDAVHAPLSDLKTLPQEIKDKMYLIHYADNWGDQDISDFPGWGIQGVRYIFD